MHTMEIFKKGAAMTPSPLLVLVFCIILRGIHEVDLLKHDFIP